MFTKYEAQDLKYVIQRAIKDIAYFETIVTNDLLIKKLDSKGELIKIAYHDVERAKRILDTCTDFISEKSQKSIASYLNNEMNYKKINSVPNGSSC